MKKQTNLFQNLNKAEINNLTHQVKETLAIGYNKQFSAADLWNIQRQRKAVSLRRGFGV